MYERCDECDKVKGKCECKHAQYTQYTEEKDHIKNKVPDVKTVIKATLGQTYVESIILDGKAMFLCNINGEVKTLQRITYEDVIYEPIEKNMSMYKDYEFKKIELDEYTKHPPTKQKILTKVNELVNHFIDTTEVNKTLTTLDSMLTYCMEWIDTVHYLYFVGETESGKSTALHILKNIGYRPMYSDNLPYADIYNFLGTQEEACGTILEDECQDLYKDRNKIATYKNSYSKGSIKPIIITGVNSKRQVPYKTFCFKAFAGERVTYDKGFMERMAVIHMVEGQPEGNVKMATPEEKKQMHYIRNALLYWKVANIREGLPEVQCDLKNRDQELWQNTLRIAKDTDFEVKTQAVVDYYIHQRHDGIWNSIEAKIFKLVLLELDETLSLKMSDFWNNLCNSQDEIEGELDKNSFYTHEYSKNISHNYLANLFKNTFQAIKETTTKTVDEKRKKSTRYVFSGEIINKLSRKYNVSNTPTSGLSGQQLGVHVDNVDHCDNLMEKPPTLGDKS